MADISKVTLLDGSTYNIKPAVIDSAPVQNSSNPVSSGGVYTSQKAQDDEIAYAINTGAKNIIDLSHVGTTISNGVTWTKNPDGSVSAKGTSTAVSSIRVAGVQGSSSYKNAVPIPKGKYIISASGFSVTKYRFALGFFENANAEREITNITTTDREFTVTSDMARYDFTCVIALAGEVMDGETWYPMIRPAVIKDDTFVPYAPTNRVIYSNVFDSGNLIQSGTDLDALKKSGRYYTETVADSASLTNNPCTDELFYMHVDSINGITIQTLWPISEDSATMYRRLCKNNTWKPWFKFMGTEVST